MMQSYVFEAPVSFSEHNFQARLGDICVYNKKTKHLVIYRDENIIIQFDISTTAIDSMEARKWIVKSVTKEKVEEPAAVATIEKVEETTAVPVLEKVEDEIVPNTPELEKEITPDPDDEFFDKESEVDSNIEESDLELEDEVLDQPVIEKKKGGRPKKSK